MGTLVVVGDSALTHGIPQEAGDFDVLLEVGSLRARARWGNAAFGSASEAGAASS